MRYNAKYSLVYLVISESSHIFKFEVFPDLAESLTLCFHKAGQGPTPE